MEEFFQQVWSILITIIDPRNLTNPDAFKAALNQPNVLWAALVVVCFIVFAETGLLFGFLFPGDSLLVVLGVVIGLCDWNVWLFIGALSIAAIIGEMVGYWIGAKAGPTIFHRPDGRCFRQRHITEAHEYFEKHGGKTLIIARFMPFVRTFVPVVAGAAKMNYRTFMLYNIVGGILWIVSMVLFGYYVLKGADAAVQNLLGKPEFTFAKHLDKLIILIVLVSVYPMLWKAWKSWRAKRKLAMLNVPRVAKKN